MSARFNLVNDYRDTIFYATVAALMVFWAFQHDLSGFAHSFDLIAFREMARVWAWHKSDETKRVILMPVAVAAMVTISVASDIPHIFMHLDEPWFICWIAFSAGSSVGLLWLLNRELLQYFGLRRTAKFYARTFWKELFDWPRKHKPPTRRIEKGVEALKRLMQKIADTASPSPLPEAA